MGGVVRNVYRRNRVLTNPISEMRLISDSMMRSNLTRKPKAKRAKPPRNIIRLSLGVESDSLRSFETLESVERNPRIRIGFRLSVAVLWPYLAWKSQKFST